MKTNRAKWGNKRVAHDRQRSVSPSPTAKQHNEDLLPFGLPLEVATYVASFSKLGEQVKLRRVCYSFKCFVDVEIAEQHVEYFAAHVSVQDDCSGDIAVSTTNYHSPWFPSERIFCSFLRMVDPFGDLGSYLLHCLLMMRPLQPLVLWSRCSHMCHFLESACLECMEKNKRRHAEHRDEFEASVVTLEELISTTQKDGSPLQSWQKLALSHVCGRHVIFSHPVESRFYDTNVTLVDMVKILLKHYHPFSLEDFRPFILKSEKLQSALKEEGKGKISTDVLCSVMQMRDALLGRDCNRSSRIEILRNLTPQGVALVTRKEYFVLPVSPTCEQATELEKACRKDYCWIPEAAVRNPNIRLLFGCEIPSTCSYTPRLLSVLSSLCETSVFSAENVKPAEELCDYQENFVKELVESGSSPLKSAKKLQLIGGFVGRDLGLHSLIFLQVLELSGIPDLVTIKKSFGFGCDALVAVRLSSLKKLQRISASFLEGRPLLQYVEIADIPEVHTIEGYFCSNCPKLEHVNFLTPMKQVATVGANCCQYCPSLKSFPLSVFQQNVIVPKGFLLHSSIAKIT